MDALPTNIVVAILRRLAEQDPLSLMQAKCVCKSFLNLAPATNWRDVFLAPYPTDENALGLKDSTALDDQVASLGGYKRLALVKARYRRASKQHTLNLNKHADKLPTTELKERKGYVDATSPPKIMARYLFIYRTL